jgi:CubicO group peptidase (beta-lactamase class C family)
VHPHVGATEDSFDLPLLVPGTALRPVRNGSLPGQLAVNRHDPGGASTTRASWPVQVLEPLRAVVLGQLLAVVAGSDYATLLDERVFGPLGMDASTVSSRGSTARPGHSSGGRRRQPWIMDGYAPAGGVITTIGDMAILATALLEDKAPGATSLRPVTGVATGKPDEGTGMFWVILTSPRTHRARIWHNGQTGGYSAYVVLYPQARRAIVVLADVARASEQQRVALGLTTWLVRADRSPTAEGVDAAGNPNPSGS